MNTRFFKIEDLCSAIEFHVLAEMGADQICYDWNGCNILVEDDDVLFITHQDSYDTCYLHRGQVLVKARVTVRGYEPEAFDRIYMPVQVP